MAGGFFLGFVQGAALSVLALAGLSLLTPVQPPAAQGRAAPPAIAASPELAPEPAPADEAAEERPAAPPPVSQPAPAAPEDEPPPPVVPGPEAGSVGLPVGSEFGRSGDLPPRLPDAASGSSPVEAGPAPAIAPPDPEAERAPTMDADRAARPEAVPDPGAPAQPDPGTSEASPEIGRPQSRAGAVPAPVPVLRPSETRDDSPRLPASDAAPAPSPAPETGEMPARAPGLPRPALDLSLPPDLSDLRRLERN